MLTSSRTAAPASHSGRTRIPTGRPDAGATGRGRGRSVEVPPGLGDGHDFTPIRTQSRGARPSRPPPRQARAGLVGFGRNAGACRTRPTRRRRPAPSARPGRDRPARSRPATPRRRRPRSSRPGSRRPDPLDVVGGIGNDVTSADAPAWRPPTVVAGRQGPLGQPGDRDPQPVRGPRPVPAIASSRTAGQARAPGPDEPLPVRPAPRDPQVAGLADAARRLVCQSAARPSYTSRPPASRSRRHRSTSSSP